MKKRYLARKALYATTNTTDSLTDQAGAAETNINRIVKSMGIHGQVPQTNRTPMSGDFTNTPEDLREMLETAHSMHLHWTKLPPELKELTPEELYHLTPEQVIAKLKKPAAPTPPDTPKDTPDT